ncbi:hypothetical protein BU25DRAFT_463188 [Macroventuria anomochaeta]|uniref:Uncharacterized protein n=1 Tax=Macroventuria anomochaeta TaxID=301207 RepID=A0ACB6RK28_9PLEO|nr:uncharacterized protein BU25DRAFT_463188 [Macroventuria anomochaeta]KAF2622052.1 hypothetical protein BU25DRAFT_463188 [Macroventuria anomochaeta]
MDEPDRKLPNDAGPVTANAVVAAWSAKDFPLQFREDDLFAPILRQSTEAEEERVFMIQTGLMYLMNLLLDPKGNVSYSITTEAIQSWVESLLETRPFKNADLCGLILLKKRSLLSKRPISLARFTVELPEESGKLVRLPAENEAEETINIQPADAHHDEATSDDTESPISIASLRANGEAARLGRYRDVPGSPYWVFQMEQQGESTEQVKS